MIKLSWIGFIFLVSIASSAGQFDDEPMIRVKYGNVETSLESVKESSKNRFGEYISFSEKEAIAIKNRQELKLYKSSEKTNDFTEQRMLTGLHRLDIVKNGDVQLQNSIVLRLLTGLKNSRNEEEQSFLVRIMSGEFLDLRIGDLNIVMEESGLDESLRYGVPSLQIGKLDVILSLDFTMALKNDAFVETEDFRSKFLELVNRPESKKPYRKKRGVFGVNSGNNFYEYFVEFQASQGLLSDARVGFIRANRSGWIERALPAETNPENTKSLLEFYLENQLLDENAIGEISDHFKKVSEFVELEKINVSEDSPNGTLQDPSAFLRTEKN
ncbi:MAG: hypothetical protein VX642_08065 [Bdellovibrionota bacterium]|nr:hypothetical protein [Bdellovibrionota bacterium]